MPAPRSGALGVTSVIIVIAMTLLVSGTAFWLALTTIGPEGGEPKPVPPVGVALAAGGIVVGIIGVVLAIVAIVTRRGRLPGIIALIIGLLSWPLSSLAAFFGYLGTL